MQGILGLNNRVFLMYNFKIKEMIKQRKNSRIKGYLEMEADREIYQICEVSVNKNEIILSVLSPTLLQLV